jgi:hypothetical protein
LSGLHSCLLIMKPRFLARRQDNLRFLCCFSHILTVYYSQPSCHSPLYETHEKSTSDVVGHTQNGQVRKREYLRKVFRQIFGPKKDKISVCEDDCPLGCCAV